MYPLTSRVSGMLVCPFIRKPFTIIFAHQRIIAIFARVEIVKAHELHPNAGGVHGLFVLSKPEMISVRQNNACNRNNSKK